MKNFKVMKIIVLWSVLGGGCSVIVRNKLENQQDLGSPTDHGLLDQSGPKISVRGEVEGREFVVIGETLKVFPGPEDFANAHHITLMPSDPREALPCPGEKVDDHFLCVVPSSAPDGEIKLVVLAEDEQVLTSFPLRIERQLLVGQAMSKVIYLHSSTDSRQLSTLDLPLPLSKMPSLSPSGRYLLLRVAENPEAMNELILLDLVLGKSVPLDVKEPVPTDPEHQDILPHSFEPEQLSLKNTFAFTPEEKLWIINDKGEVMLLQLPLTIEVGQPQWLTFATNEPVPMRQVYWGVSPSGQKKLMGLSTQTATEGDSGVHYYDEASFQTASGPAGWTPVQISSLIPADSAEKKLRDEVAFLVLLKNGNGVDYALNAYLHQDNGTRELFIPPKMLTTPISGEALRPRNLNQIPGTNLIGFDLVENPNINYMYGLISFDTGAYNWILKDTTYLQLRNKFVSGQPATMNSWQMLVQTPTQFFVHDHLASTPALAAQDLDNLKSVVHHPRKKIVYTLTTGEIISFDYTSDTLDSRTQALNNRIINGGILIQP